MQTHSQYVTLIAFLRLQWLPERASIFHYKQTARLVYIFSTLIDLFFEMLVPLRKTSDCNLATYQPKNVTTVHGQTILCLQEINKWSDEIMGEHRLCNRRHVFHLSLEIAITIKIRISERVVLQDQSLRMKEVLPASSGWMNSVQTEGEVKSARGNITIIPKGCQDYGQATIWNRKRAQILCTVLANGLYNGCTSSLVQLRIHSNLIRPSEFASSMLL